MRENEIALVSCLLNEPKYKSYVGEVTGEYFEDKNLGYIFDSIKSDSILPTIINTVKDKIPAKELFEISEVVKMATPQTTEYYGMYVVEDYKQRKLKDVSNMKLEEADELIRKLKGLGVAEKPKESTSEAFLKDLERIYRKEPDPCLIPTGFWSIDDRLKGFRNTELVIIGGRPAMGKTTLGMNIAYNMAKKGKHVAFFSLEMAKKELHQRLVKLHTNISNLYEIDQKQFESCISASKYIDETLPLNILDKADQTIEGIYSISRKLKDKNELDIIFVDHLSILKSKKSFKSRYEEVSDISRQLKVIAKDLDVPVVALCQLNRAVEGREVKLPTMADLRDSGSIEQDADIIGFIHRQSYYDIQKGEKPNEAEQSQAVFCICKNRRGGVGPNDLSFNRHIPSFY